MYTNCPALPRTRFCTRFLGIFMGLCGIVEYHHLGEQENSFKRQGFWHCMIFYDIQVISASLSAEPQRQKGSKYGKSRKIKVLRDFLFLFSDIYQ